MLKISFIRTFTTTSLVSLSFLLCSFFANGEQSEQAAGISLDALQKSGYRMNWMNQSTSKGLHLLTLIGDSLYAIDNDDFITRYNSESGKWLWSTAIGNHVYELHGISESTTDNRVYVISDGAIYLVEKATGNYPIQDNTENNVFSEKRQVLPLKWTANTPAIEAEEFYFVYGSTGGDIVWFNSAIGFDTKRYNVGSLIKTPLILASGIRYSEDNYSLVIIASSKNGNVVGVDLKSVSRLWSLQLTSPVTAAAAFGTNSKIMLDEELQRTSVFIAGTDQYLRAVDLHTGKRRWNILTTAKLVDPPVFLKDRVYQRIPNSGLASYFAFPGLLSGKQEWLANDVFGNVITTTKQGKLVCWDQENSILQIVDPRKGGVISTLSIPNIKTIISDKPTYGSLTALTNDNLLFHLVPRQ